MFSRFGVAPLGIGSDTVVLAVAFPGAIVDIILFRDIVGAARGVPAMGLTIAVSEAARA